MRSFYVLLATLIASPLVSARTINVDSKKFEALQKAFADFQSSVKGEDGSSSIPTFDPNARSVVVDTEEDGVAGSTGSNSNTPSVVVDTVEEPLAGTNLGVAGGKCANQGKNCNNFPNWLGCWQFCAASKATINPRSGDCAAWCVSNCGCTQPANLALGFTTSTTAGAAAPTPHDLVFGPGQAAPGTTNHHVKRRAVDNVAHAA
ncbi:MAG: hypothetical protein M1816_002855 [Peltula sp. TS41687]|nr:MAG: hypothetical protein M1816_002855 [Peltula sp. TS41687]